MDDALVGRVLGSLTGNVQHALHELLGVRLHNTAYQKMHSTFMMIDNTERQ